MAENSASKILRGVTNATPAPSVSATTTTMPKTTSVTSKPTGITKSRGRSVSRGRSTIQEGLLHAAVRSYSQPQVEDLEDHEDPDTSMGSSSEDEVQLVTTATKVPTKPPHETGIQQSIWANAKPKPLTCLPAAKLAAKPVSQHIAAKATTPAKTAAALELALEALETLKMAAKLDSKFEALATELAAKLASKPAASQQRVNQPAAPSYAATAAKGLNPLKLKPSAPTPMSAPSSAAKPPVQKPQKRRFVVLEAPLVMQEDFQPMVTEDCLHFRNRLNNCIGKPMISTLRQSSKGNLILEPAKTHSANEIISAYDKFSDLTRLWGKPVVPEQWIKLIAHGVPTAIECQAATLTEAFATELKFSQVELVGHAYWLNPAIKQSGSISFAIRDPQQAAQALKGLKIAGQFCRVVRKEPFTLLTRCFRCQGVGHNPRTCRALPVPKPPTSQPASQATPPMPTAKPATKPAIKPATKLATTATPATSAAKLTASAQRRIQAALAAM